MRVFYASSNATDVEIKIYKRLICMIILHDKIYHMTEMIATITERGQVSVPSRIRKLANLKPGVILKWEMLSSKEFRVTVSEKPTAQGPYAVLGWIKRSNPDETRSTDEIMRELRAGDED